MTSLRESGRAITNNKRLFILMLVMQCFFLIAFFAIFITYQLLLFQNLEHITNGIQDIAIEGQPQFADLTDTFAAINAQYEQLIMNVIALFSWLLVTFLIGNGIVWSISHVIISRRTFVSYFLRFCTISLAAVILIVIIGYPVVQKVMVRPELVSLMMKILPPAVLVITYFLVVSFTLLNLPLKSYPRQLWKAAVQRIYYFLPLIAAFSALHVGIVMVTYHYVMTFWGLLLSVIFLTVALSVSKIYLIAFSRRIIDETHHT
jgi:hypothetical protein